MQMLPPNINQNGSTKGEFGRTKPSIASANTECSTILSNRSLRTELSIEKNFAIKRGGGGLAINLYLKLNTYAKDLKFQEFVVD